MHKAPLSLDKMSQNERAIHLLEAVEAKCRELNLVHCRHTDYRTHIYAYGQGVVDERHPEIDVSIIPLGRSFSSLSIGRSSFDDAAAFVDGMTSVGFNRAFAERVGQVAAICLTSPDYQMSVSQ